MAKSILTVDILSPEKTLFSGEAQAVFLPGTASPFEVLPSHAPIISALERGVVRVRADKELSFPVASGFVKVEDNKVTVCVES